MDLRVSLPARLVVTTLLGAAGCTAGPPPSLDLTTHEFSAPIVGYDDKGVCELSYRFLPVATPADTASIRAIWTCTLDWSAVVPPSVGIHGVGGNLRYELCSSDDVIAIGDAVTGMMVLGKTYTFSDTLAVPARVTKGPLTPRWRLTCHGQTMRVVACGPVTRATTTQAGATHDR
jgi:hypothetical protein